MDLFSYQSQRSESIPSENPVLTVTELTKRIRALLENKFGEIQVQGEISNYRSPGSGHLYFTLKDESSVLQAVMFRGDASRIRFPLKEGLLVKAKGRITVYDARGQYQIQIQNLEIAGQGTLQQQFEALKQKLASEGLFDSERKKKLPIFPEKVGLITSLQGAVIQDFLRILQRRAPGILVQVRGVRVQGEGAAEEMMEALSAFQKDPSIDVIILARGGGSLEDLWEFNRESPARAIAACPFPTISAVGHETDFTIADFVADLRAPTPSAAAELLSRDWGEWRDQIKQTQIRLHRHVLSTLEYERERMKRLAQSPLFREPMRIVQNYQQKVDDLQQSLKQGLQKAILHKKHRHEKNQLRWTHLDPRRWLSQKKESLQSWHHRLQSLGPEQTLKRGFAWVTDSQGKLVQTPTEKLAGKNLHIRLAQGSIESKVEKINLL